MASDSRLTVHAYHCGCVYFRIDFSQLGCLHSVASFLHPVAMTRAAEYDRLGILLVSVYMMARLRRVSAAMTQLMITDRWVGADVKDERNAGTRRRRRGVCCRRVPGNRGVGSGFSDGQLVISLSILYVSWLADPLTANGRTCGRSADGAKSCARCRWNVNASAISSQLYLQGNGGRDGWKREGNGQWGGREQEESAWREGRVRTAAAAACPFLKSWIALSNGHRLTTAKAGLECVYVLCVDTKFCEWITASDLYDVLCHFA